MRFLLYKAFEKSDNSKTPNIDYGTYNYELRVIGIELNNITRLFNSYKLKL